MNDKRSSTNFNISFNFRDEIYGIVATIVSAFVSIFISKDFFEDYGVVSAIIYVVILLSIYLLVKKIIEFVARHIKTHREISNLNKNIIPESRKNEYCDLFHFLVKNEVKSILETHKTLLQLLKYDLSNIPKAQSGQNNAKKNLSERERSECLFYFTTLQKKYTDIVDVYQFIVAHSDWCINNPNYGNTVSLNEACIIANCLQSTIDEQLIMLNAMIDVSDKLREKYDKVKIDITDIIQKLKTL